jgi:hypothetical protein
MATGFRLFSFLCSAMRDCVWWRRGRKGGGRNTVRGGEGERRRGEGGLRVCTIARHRRERRETHDDSQRKGR